jgi:hypothetical protein
LTNSFPLKVDAYIDWPSTFNDGIIPYYFTLILALKVGERWFGVEDGVRDSLVDQVAYIGED